MKLPAFRLSLLSRLLSLFFISLTGVHTTAAAEIFVCTGKDGVRTYQNSGQGEGCKPLNLNPITVLPAPSSLGKPSGNSSGNSSFSEGKPSNPYASMQASDFDAKNDRMKIVQEELRIEEGKLKSLEEEYKNGQPDRQGNEKNYQKYLDRTARLERDIKSTRENIQILQKELGKLSER